MLLSAGMTTVSGLMGLRSFKGPGIGKNGSRAATCQRCRSGIRLVRNCQLHGMLPLQMAGLITADKWMLHL